jgi:hypothetical protein
MTKTQFFWFLVATPFVWVALMLYAFWLNGDS